MRATILSLALVSTLAFGQGVPLTTPATPSAADQAKFDKLAKEPWVASISPVKVNPYALDSKVITVVVDGKEFKFVGERQAPTPAIVYVNGKATENTVESWAGTSGEDTARFSRDGSRISGTLTINWVTYQLADGAVIKTKTPPASEKDMAEERAEARKKGTKK